MNNVEKGKIGEDIAVEFLKKKGATIKERNFRGIFGEIDIIAFFNTTEIVFIEVKSRSSCRYGFPAEAVGKSKQNKIRKTAEEYIIKNNLHRVSIRFDVVEIYMNDKKIRHIVNAF
ncbi:YraN family protein [Peptacetobacter sp.]|uniref:YraN family protein n=1 Tax=Peptacetobacter sp. TaxID=2991975 RepID=UPI003AB8784E